jgi:TonB family protein
MMLTRGLPASVLIHAIVLVVVVMYGNHVVRHPIRPSRSISVKMVRMPEQQATPAETRVEPAVPPESQPEIKPDLPPKELPKPPKEDPPKVVKKPQEEIEVPDPADEPAEVADDAAPTVATPTVSGPSVAGTDTHFPFDWYLSRIDGLIKRNWEPRQHNFGRKAILSCAVHFEIARNGTVTQVTLIRNSGVGIFDREALRAAQTTRMPPLPPQFTGSSLGVTVNFNLEPGT